jgi:hypothetical protein
MATMAITTNSSIRVKALRNWKSLGPDMSLQLPNTRKEIPLKYNWKKWKSGSGGRDCERKKPSGAVPPMAWE